MSVEEFRSKRGYVKGKLTRIGTFVGDVQSKKIVPTIEDILVRLEKVDSIDNEFQNIMEKLIEHSDNYTLSPEDIVEEDKFDNRFFEVKALLERLKEMLRSHEAKKNAGAGVSSGENAEVTTSLDQVSQQVELLRQISMHQSERSSTPNISSRVKLLIINFPTFDGKVEEWKRFSDSFKTLIHDSDLPNVQKHQYLVSALSGNAAKTLEAIEISEDNYNVVWQLLKDRFDNNKIIRRRHIQCLFKMPQVERESSAAIQNLIDHTQKHLRILKSMKLPTDS